MDTTKQSRPGGCAPTAGSDSSARLSGLTENDKDQVEIYTNQVIHEAVWAFSLVRQGDLEDAKKAFSDMREWITEMERICSQNVNVEQPMRKERQ